MTTRQLRAEVARLQAEVEKVRSDMDMLWKSVADKNAEILRLRATLADLRERSVEESIHHFVKRIDTALSAPQQPSTGVSRSS